MTAGGSSGEEGTWGAAGLVVCVVNWTEEKSWRFTFFYRENLEKSVS